ncbi:MAG: glycerophosphodiester phosphodiesterase [Solirubrobacterales bacterium]
MFADPPVLCGHRGLGRGTVEGRRENTLASFQAAADAGISWVEVDARLNRDGMLVSLHDPAVEDGRLVSRLTTAETDELELMRLADLFEGLAPEVSVDLEVKSSLEDALRPRGETTAAIVADLVGREAGDRTVLVSSFDPSAIAIARERLPDVPIGLLTWRRFPLRKAIAAAVHLDAQVVAPHFESLVHPQERDVAELLEVAHEAGLQVLTWSMGHDDLEGLAAIGVDCMCIDDVPSALASPPQWQPRPA